MDSEPRYTPIVREPELQRVTAAARAVLAELERLRDIIGHRPTLLAHLLAGRALVADDEHGRRHGVVGQADGLHWSELDRLAGAAESAVDAGAHAGPGTWHPNCPECEVLAAVARIRARHRYRTVGPRPRPESKPDAPPGVPLAPPADDSAQ
jgi:hypothetical protein